MCGEGQGPDNLDLCCDGNAIGACFMMDYLVAGSHTCEYFMDAMCQSYTEWDQDPTNHMDVDCHSSGIGCSIMDLKQADGWYAHSRLKWGATRYQCN